MSDEAALNGIRPVRYITVNSGSERGIDGQVVEEIQACISVNGSELATFMCSPNDLHHLAHGFLYNEGIIESLDDIHHSRLNDNYCVDIWLNRDFTPPERLIVTAGCGGGVTFDDLSQQHEPLRSELGVQVDELVSLMKGMHLGATLYQAARGIHTAVLADREQVLLQVEDIGRHNCLDKLRGLALEQKVETAGKILLSSGRISSEMINKARRFETPIVCSRTSPTSLSVALAEQWGITIVAYLRQDRMRVYSHPERILDLEQV